MERRARTHLLGDVLEVRLVVDRQDHFRDARTHSAEHLFFQATDRQYPPGERQLSRHRHVASDLAARHSGHERGRHRDPRRRTVLRDGSGRNVDMHISATQGIFLDAQTLPVRLRERERRASRLLHDVAQLAGERKATVGLSWHDARLDEHDVTTHRRVKHAGRHAHRVFGGDALRVNPGPAQEFTHVISGRVDLGDLIPGDLASDLASESPNLPLQLPHTRLARVALHDAENRIVLHLQLFVGEAVLLALARQQIPLGDLELLEFGVACEVDTFHAIEQRAGNSVQVVRRRDEKHFGEVEGNPQIVIDDRRILARVEHLQQRGTGVALERDPELVDLVEQEDGVLGLGLPHPLDDSARHGTHIGATMSANVGLVTRTTQRDAYVLAAQGACDRLGDRGLPHSRRSHEEEDGTATRMRLGRVVQVLVATIGSVGRVLRFIASGCRLALGLIQAIQLELTHREELEDAILDVLEAIVVVLENLGCLREVDLLLGTLVPRQLSHPLQEGADDLVLGRLRAGTLETSELAIDLGALLFAQLECFDPLAHLLDVVALFPVAELFLDRPELLPEQHLALTLPELRLHLGLDVLLGVDAREFALHGDETCAHAGLVVESLEQLLLIRRLELQIERDEIGERAGIVHALDELVQRLSGHTAPGPELGRPIPQFAVEGLERGVIRVLRLLGLHFQKHRLQHRLSLVVVREGLCAAFALHQQLHAASYSVGLNDANHRPRVVQELRKRLVHVLALCNGEHATISVQRFLHGLDGSRSTG